MMMMEKNTGLVGDARAFGADEADENPQDAMAGMLEQENDATPEEQADYDMVVARAIKFMHGDGRDQTLKMLGSGTRPAETIGATAATIVQAITQSAQEAGKKIDDGVLFHAGVEIVEELADYGEQAGVFKFSSPDEAQKETEEGFLYALKFYGESGLQSGAISEEDRQSAQGLMQQGLQREQQYGHPDVVNGVRSAMSSQMGGAQQAPAGGGIIGQAMRGGA